MKKFISFCSLIAGIALTSAPALALTGGAMSLALDQPNYSLTEDINLSITGAPGQFGILLLDTDNTPSNRYGIPNLQIGFSANLAYLPIILPPSGTLNFPCEVTCALQAMLTGQPPLTIQAISLSPRSAQLCASNSVLLNIDALHGNCGDCAPCSDGIDALTMRYLGDSTSFVEVIEIDGCGAIPTTYFAGTLAPFQIFSFDHDDGVDHTVARCPGRSGRLNGKFSKRLTFRINGEIDMVLRTDCVSPVAPQRSFGDFFVIEASSKGGGPICPLPTTAGDDCDAGKPVSLRFQYTGEDCSASNHDQGPASASCSGDPADEAIVNIRILGSHGTVYFDGDVALDGEFTVAAADAGETKFDNSLIVEISTTTGTLLQTLTLHVSCSEPIGVGDAYGALDLIGYIAG